MKYLNMHLRKIVEVEKYVVREGCEADIKGKSYTSIPAYVVESMNGRDKMYMHSSKELRDRLARNLMGEWGTIELDVQFESDKESYPYSAKDGVETIADLHNMKVAPYNKPIGNLNPFIPRIDNSVLTIEQAEQWIEDNS